MTKRSLNDKKVIKWIKGGSYNFSKRLKKVIRNFWESKHIFWKVEKCHWE